MMLLMHRSRFLLLVLVSLFNVRRVPCLEVCSDKNSEEGPFETTGGSIKKSKSNSLEWTNRSSDAVCPTHDTCCPIKNQQDHYGCIPADLGKYNATCCHDDHDHHYLTGCGIGYECQSHLVTEEKNGRRKNNYVCQATDQIQDPLVQTLPRYRLCTTTEGLKHQYGLTIPFNEDTTSSTTAADDSTTTSNGRLAYYSTHGDLTKQNSIIFQNVQTAVIVIHGATRNADDYWCSMVTAAEQFSGTPQQTSILVVAPHFANVGDPDLQLEGAGGPALQWKQDHDGAWRYGADAVYPFSAKNKHLHLPSSFDGVDALVTLFQNTTAFPSLTRIVVAGHSSGGQFVQRWALLTSVVWDSQRMRAVVANPSSYAYLTPYRFVEGEWKIPSTTFKNKSCPQYNQWEWGLQAPDGKDSVRYLNLSLQRLNGNRTALIERFLGRRIIYMIGSQDRCNTTGRADWCYSHGLETTCADQLQGLTRYERAFHYYRSLLRYSKKFTQMHTIRVVEQVGHDHSLMFNSPEGLQTLFLDS